ncbi:uncharacterized protein LOC116245554 [Nymphaea colorata]|uniref:uncharacterized protein LOC116245554 n=1 Tax=Nymphaea colorata TaxID=210225 RepID=UPI00129E8D12|nr:uncharacterized protein LOC116245554 [Nymphaea colorata]
MRAQGVLLSRRKTGGGAVYHDLGNTCFSFLTPYQQGQEYDYKTISGSAYRLYLGGKDGKGRKALHHGTVLFSVDLQALQKYLNPNKKKLESKGVSSVIARVMNLSEHYPQLGHESFCKELETAFQEHYGGTAER